MFNKQKQKKLFIHRIQNSDYISVQHNRRYAYMYILYTVYSIYLDI